MATLFSPGPLTGIREYVVAFLAAVILASFARTFVVQALRIPSRSMEPGLLAGDHILVNKFIYGGDRLGDPAPPRALPMRSVRRGDVVIFTGPFDPSQTYIKRCLALAGQVVEGDASGLRVDRRRLEESGYISDAGAGRPFGPTTVPQDHLFCLGDHRGLSNDSRAWGAVPETRLRGRAFMIYWSIEAREPHGGRSTSSGTPGTWDKMRASLRGLVRWPLDSRWKRSLKLVR